LIDGTLDAPIDRDETGTPIEAGSVWTGTATDGTPITPCCADWTSIDSGAATGLTTATDATWTFNAGFACNNAGHLYCFEQ
jgi:hypothetical protein